MSTTSPSGAGPMSVAAGLAADEAARRHADFGPNIVRVRRDRHLRDRLLTQVRDPMILLLVAAAVVASSMGDTVDALVISLVIVINTTVGVVQELRAARAIDALADLAAPMARVRRDGADLLVPAAEVVPGDVMVLTGGDVVAADGELAEAVQVQVDESALTGESVPVDKSVTGPPEDRRVRAGTVITHGRGAAVVTAIGADSALGRIAALLAGEKPRPTPLQARLARLGRLLALSVLAASAMVAALGVLRGEPVWAMLLVGVSVAVAVVPESLPAVVTLALALGARRMAQRSAVVRNLPAVETLGTVSVLAVDKTGTLTEGRMVATRVWTPDGTEYEVTGDGYAPIGDIRPTTGGPVAGGPVTGGSVTGVTGGPEAGGSVEARVGTGGPVERRVGAGGSVEGGPAGGGVVGGGPEAGWAGGLPALLRGAVLCNDADLVAPGEEGAWGAVGDPLEAALLALAGKGGVDGAECRRAYPRVGEVPFDSTRKRMITVHRPPQGGRLVICKGAPDVLVAMIGDAAAAALDKAHELAASGYRVLAVAEAWTDPRPADHRAAVTMDGDVQSAAAVVEGDVQSAAAVVEGDVQRAAATMDGDDHPTAAVVDGDGHCAAVALEGGGHREVVGSVDGGGREGGEVVGASWGDAVARPGPVASAEVGRGEGGDDMGSGRGQAEHRAGVPGDAGGLGDLERGLRIIGLVAVVDPPRAHAAGAVAACRRAGIRFRLITGDHPAVAAAVAEWVGIPVTAAQVLTGPEIAAGVPPERLAAARVFARTLPEQKLDIVRALQQEGHVVAMTGDGVNDGPALRRADIGVAMGRGGTEVARQAADLVLTDDDLRTVASAVEEGRRVYANIRRFLRYGLSGGLAELLVMLALPFIGPAVALQPAQILWINMLTHGLPGVAMGAEPADPAAMRRPPRPLRQSILSGLLGPIAVTGTAIALIAVGLGAWAWYSGGPWQSMIFVTLGVAQLGVALAVRAPRTPGHRRHIRFLDLAVLGALILQIAPLYVDPLRRLLRVEPLSPRDLLLAATLALIPGTVLALTRHRARRVPKNPA
ncbi:cation-translocating P-type ATPase [Sphaerisporangium sp. B11E5]|uniref:cation-translocating P-type ATPase n=1 Tax=Sphaerisporangium sp. B11E5 TaxID=3153563 RepID=UPI00325EB27C